MNDYLSMKELGALYGVSSHVVGKVFKGANLRTQTGKPTQRAFQEGFVTPRWSMNGETYFYVWNKDKGMAVLDGAGLKRMGDGNAA